MSNYCVYCRIYDFQYLVIDDISWKPWKLSAFICCRELYEYHYRDSWIRNE